MGTYIGMGMVGEYIIPKKELSEMLQMEFIPTKTDEEIKKEISNAIEICVPFWYINIFFYFCRNI